MLGRIIHAVRLIGLLLLSACMAATALQRVESWLRLQDLGIAIRLLTLVAVLSITIAAYLRWTSFSPYIRFAVWCVCGAWVNTVLSAGVDVEGRPVVVAGLIGAAMAWWLPRPVKLVLAYLPGGPFGILGLILEAIHAWKERLERPPTPELDPAIWHHRDNGIYTDWAVVRGGPL